MKLNLVKETDPILFKECNDFDFENPETDPVELAKNLNETMIHHKGLGLSANQVGLPYKVFVVRVEDETPCAFFNPRIVNISENKVSMQEGCLSFPLLFLKVIIKKSSFLFSNSFTTMYGNSPFPANIIIFFIQNYGRQKDLLLSPDIKSKSLLIKLSTGYG